MVTITFPRGKPGSDRARSTGRYSGTRTGTRQSAALVPAFAAILAAGVMILIGTVQAVAGAPQTPPPTAPLGAKGSWWSQVREQIQAAEYEISWQNYTVLADLDRAWHAPNRSHNVRTYFTDDGIRVVRRTESTPSWELGLSLIGSGRGESVSLVGKATLSPLGNRIDYDRTEIVEWYVNDRRGLEQGFTLAVPPEGLIARETDGRQVVGGRRSLSDGKVDDERDPAFLVLALEGSLSTVISPDGLAIDFAAPGGGKVLHYAHLKVIDARGQELSSWMEGFAESGTRGLRIVFDDAEADYPVTVDPLITSPAWTAESNQQSSYFALSVSTAGDVNGDGYADVIVGAPHYDCGQSDEGWAFVYHGSPTGPSLTPDWTAESDQAGATLGASVSTAGDINGDGYADVVVGAFGYDNGEADEGRVYAYHGSPAGLSTSPDWTAESNRIDSSFGRSVSTAGDVNGDGYTDIIIGAQDYESAFDGEGRAYVYHGSAAGLSNTAAWTAEGGQAFAGFGSSASTAGDVNGDGYADVVVGTPGHENGEAGEGGAFVYLGSAAGLSTSPDWSAEGNQAAAQLGCSVSTAGDVNGDGYADVIVGAQGYANGEASEGGTFVYHGSPAGLNPSAAWIAEGDQIGAYLGNSVSTAGDINGDGYADIVVGSYLFDNGETDEGRAYVYHGSTTGLISSADWMAESDMAVALFGHSVSTAGDVNGDGYADIIIGADGYASPDANEGRAYVYLGSPAGLNAAVGWSVVGDQDSASLGFSVSTAGDVNGDGFADVVVGAHDYDNGETDEGRAFIYHGSAGGPSDSPDWIAESNQAEAAFGWSVSTAGDVNGDGYSDVIVAAQRYDNGEGDEGRVFVYHGSPMGTSISPDWIAESDSGGACFGSSVSTAGDVNGDGYADVIVGAEWHANGQPGEGRASVYHGSATGLSATAAWDVEGDQEMALLGSSVSTAGDVNGDGYFDVIVGARQYDNDQANEGHVFVYHGSASGLSTSADWTAESGEPGSAFGYSVSTAGDVNGDGYSDVIVGAPCYDNVESLEGWAFVYHGSASGLSTSADWTAESDQISAAFGGSVSTAGDVNGDGYADVIVGAFGYVNSQLEEGRAYVYHGSAAGLSAHADWTADGNLASAYFGVSVSTAGDVNGDGYADVIVGAYGFDSLNWDEGAAWVYYGNDGPGLMVRPQQRRVDDLAPIAHGGRSRESGSFRLAARGQTPFGRGRIRMESEIKPLGQSFDGTGTQQSEWLDTGTASVALSDLITGLEPGAHHWRMRLLYDPVKSPFQSASRWFTVPWNGWDEQDLTVSPFLGGTVWEDRDGNGIMQPDEPRLYGVLVHLLDDAGWVLQTTVSGGDGSYRFDVGSGEPLRIQFEAPAGWAFTLPDQGVDDLMDSDADTVSGMTPLIAPPFDSLDEERWSAGLGRVGICWSPDETVYIYDVTLSTDGNDYPVLHFQDPNQRSAVTGYNVYRSSDAGLPHAQWPLMADDVIDMDEATPNKQYVDTTGDPSPSGLWYFQVAPYNHDCPEETAEGPW